MDLNHNFEYPDNPTFRRRLQIMFVSALIGGVLIGMGILALAGSIYHALNG
jgi:hypothetical protein